MRSIFFFLICFFLFSSCNQKKDVLIIGDSISIGYTPFVKEDLASKANVVHNYGNARYTGNGVDSLTNWIGTTNWDVIHFNFGLHDLCYRSATKNRDKIHGKLTTTLEQYEVNLQRIVDILKQTNAKLIFATTTFVPNNEPGRFAEDVDKYNTVAIKVMKKNNIQINDLYYISIKVHKEYGNGNSDVHYSKKGYKLLSEPVIKVIDENL